MNEEQLCTTSLSESLKWNGPPLKVLWVQPPVHVVFGSTHTHTHIYIHFKQSYINNIHKLEFQQTWLFISFLRLLLHLVNFYATEKVNLEQAACSKSNQRWRLLTGHMEVWELTHHIWLVGPRPCVVVSKDCRNLCTAYTTQVAWGQIHIIPITYHRWCDCLYLLIWGRLPPTPTCKFSPSDFSV